MSKIELRKRRNKSKKRVGRGISAGGGKTAGRGTKGQKSRSGHNIPKQFEGGQTPLSMRLPKLPGFKSHRKDARIISLDDISRVFSDGEKVGPESLMEKGLIKKSDRYKILNNGELTVSVELEDGVSVSGSAVKAFKKKGKKAPSKKTAKSGKSK